MSHHTHSAASLVLIGLLAVACAASDTGADEIESQAGEAEAALTVAQAQLAQWSSLVPLPLVPVSAANLPDGTVLLWAAEDRFGFGQDLGRTYSVLYDPATGATTERLVNETDHSMFCPGTANLPDGSVLVNGGLSAGTTSIYNPSTSTWTRAADMNIPRAYQGTTPLQDGSVFTLGGSWAGGVGNKHAEVWTPDQWRLLSGVRIDPFLSVDDTRDFGMDSHLWLMAAGNGRVFHAGPGIEMHWVATTGNGSVTNVGTRGDDEFSINANAVMFDTGKILKVGGAPGYDSLPANGNAYVIELGADVTVRKLAGMAYHRAFHNSVVLPNGQVVVIGGATFAVGFSDNNSVLAPEIFDPVTETFTVLPAMAVPRNYHSIALLLPNGRVLTGGGGLCGAGCATNHQDLQILSPPYLFNADGTPATRPVITAAPTQVVHGALMNVTTNGPISAFSVVRLASTTHAVNNDQRRLSLSFSETSPNQYAVQVPSNPGWAVPGQYMLFAMNAQGTPSLARTVRIGSTTVLPLSPVPDQASLFGDPLSLALTASSPSGNPLTFGATGLPDGLSLNLATGVISGTPNGLGKSLVEVAASDGIQTVSTQFVWDVGMGDNIPPTLATPAPGTIAINTPVTLPLIASDADGDTLTYSASGLPPGLILNTSTGVISGSATTPATYNVSASVADGRGGTATVSFGWVVGVNPPTLLPVVAPLQASGQVTSYTASASGGGGALEYNWSFGDGTTDSGYQASPGVSHTFAKPGVYIVTLTVRNALGDYVSTQFVQAIAGPTVAGQARASSNLLEEPRSGQSARFWTANIDNDTVSVFDRQGLVKVAEIAVGSRPRSLALAPDGRIWVANKGSSTLSVINTTSLSVVQTVTLPLASQPFGVVCAADGSVFVTLEATGEVMKLDAAGTQLLRKSLASNLRHLALSPAGDKLLASRFITPPIPGETSAFVESSVGGVLRGAELLLLSPSTLGKTRTITLRFSSKPDSTISGRGVPNYLGAPAIAPDAKTAWVPSKQDNLQRGTLRDGLNLDFQNTVRAISSRVDLVTSAEDYAGRIDFDNSGVASAAAYHPSGAYLFVALEASRQVAVVDAAGKRELFRANAGLAPQAVAVSGDGHTLYVHNALDRSVSVYDLSPLIDTGSRTLPLLGELSAVAVEKLAPGVLRGKQLFYDARDTRLARDAYLSCAACHNDGGHDGRVWDLTGLGEGLRNTISLRGRAGAQGRQHWTGNFDEVQDFEGQIRKLSQGTGLMTDAAFQTGTRSQPLGDPKAGISADLDALATYVASLATPDASPYRLATGGLTRAAASGKLLFARECVTCHGGQDFSDSPFLAVRDIGTLRPSSGTRLGQPLLGLDTPGLRGSWATAPYLHDGSATTLDAAILAHTTITPNVALTATERSRVVAFVQQMGAEEPVVVPQPGLTGQYFANPTLSGTVAFSRNEGVKFNWGTGSPTGLPVDGFSVRWTGKVVPTKTGNHRFQTNSDDGVRVWLNGALVIDTWYTMGLALAYSGDIALTAGQRYDIKLEYHELGGNARLSLNWLLPGARSCVVVPITSLEPAGAGLMASYFTNNSLSGSPALVRYEAPYFDWGNESPDPSLPDNDFSVRWLGTFQPAVDGLYQFQTNSDDGVRLWINHALVIDNWTPHAPTLNTSSAIQLFAGQRYDIKLEFQEFGGGALLQLGWQPPGQSSYTALPLDRLFAN